MSINPNSSIRVTGYKGTWHIVVRMEDDGQNLFLLEHDTYGDEAACLIVDENMNLVCEDVWNGFDDYFEQKESQKM